MRIVIISVIAVVMTFSSWFFYKDYFSEKPSDYELYLQTRQLAERGDTDAQFRLGVMLLQGYGIEPNPVKAKVWLDEAATQGNADAQYQLALYHQGEYEITNDEQQGHLAFGWLRKASESGSSEALVELGKMYVEGGIVAGLEIKVDLHNAAIMFRRAAEQNNSEAMFQLARLIEKYPNLAANDENSLTLYEEASDLGNANAQYFLSIIYMNDYTIRFKYELGEELLLKSAGQGHKYAQLKLGLRSSDREAIIYFRRAAHQDLAQAHYELGRIYLGRYSVDKDIDLAEYHFRKAIDLGYYKARERLIPILAEKGDAESQYYYANMLVKQSRDQGDYFLSDLAVSWYEKSANQGYALAQNQLGSHYIMGEPEQAFKWYQKAARQGISPAQWNLSLLYATGEAGITDLVKAKMWRVISDRLRPEADLYHSGRWNAHSQLPPLTASQEKEAIKLADHCMEVNYEGCY